MLALRVFNPAPCQKHDHTQVAVVFESAIPTLFRREFFNMAINSSPVSSIFLKT